jgi:hypothetical protein
MTKTLTETLLFASVALNAALLIFFAEVLRQILDTVDVATFKNLIDLLVRYSSKSPFMIIALNLPIIVAIPYYWLYGFGNWWITASIALWLVSGSISKMLKLPAYKAISTLKSDDADSLNEARRKLNTGNAFQAICYSIALVLMIPGLR